MAGRRLAWLWRPGLWITLIVIAHLGLAVGWSVSVPLFEMNDEPSHVLFVRYLQVNHQLPVQDKNTAGPRAHHPPLLYVVGALLTAWVPVTGPLATLDQIRMETNPNFRVVPGDTEADNKSHYVHFTPDERFPYAGLPLQVHLLRLLSAALSTAAIALIYLTARRLSPDDPGLALLAAALVAFNPDVIMFAAVFYNDTAALFGGALVLYAVTRAARRGFTPGRWFWISVALGIGVLLKLSVLALALPVGLAWLWETGANAKRQWRQARRTVVTRTLVSAAALAGPVAALTGWWFVRNLKLYGDLTANSAIVALWGKPSAEQTSVWRQTLTLLNDPLGHFGTGAWISFPAWTYTAAQVVIVAGLLGAAVAGARWALAQRASLAAGPSGASWPALARTIAADPTARLWGFHAAAFVVIEASVVYYAVTVVGWTATRFVYPAFASIAMLLAAGLRFWAGPRWRGWLSWAVALAGLALALYGLVGLIIPTYGPPPAPTAAELARMTPLDAQMGGTARLLGYQLDSSHVHAEGVVAVTLYWEPTARTAKPYTVFVHLFQPGVGSLAQRDTYPGGGNWSTTVWDLGRPFVETYRLHVPPESLPVAGGQILVGLYDRNTMARLPVTGQEAVPDQGWIAFGSINLQP